MQEANSFKNSLTLIVAVAAGLSLCLAESALAGSLVAWGHNGFGQCSDIPGGAYEINNVWYSNSSDFAAVAAGRWHGLVLKTDGSLAAWGDNTYNQCNVPGGNNFVAVAPGYKHSFALKADGSLAAWGYNDYGQCSDIPGGAHEIDNVWYSNSSDFTAIAGRAWHNLALKADGSLAAWGSNYFGQCDVPAGSNFVAIAAGSLYSLALKADGSLVAWGRDGYGQCNVPAGNDYIAIAAGEGYGLAIVGEPVLIVQIDIKPGSCPNPVNVKSSGVLPIAILGTDDYDITTIDPTSIRLAGVEPLRSGYEDVATPVSDGNDCNCITDGPDGFLDLTLKFKTQRIVEAIGEVNDGDVRVLTLTGVLIAPMPFETPIEGADCILIRGRHKPINPADINKDGVVNAADFAIIAENWLQSTIVDD